MSRQKDTAKKKIAPLNDYLSDRIAKMERSTHETNISFDINLDGTGLAKLEFQIGMFKHLLETFAKHSLIDITGRIQGDLEVDQHHTIEDVGIVLGQTIYKALRPFKGINRSGFFGFPMDEAFALTAVDFNGRMALQFEGQFFRRFCGDFDTDLTKTFFKALARGARANVVIKLLNGKNDHHKLEVIFKSFAKSVKMAITREPRLKEQIPSTKGMI